MTHYYEMFPEVKFEDADLIARSSNINGVSGHFATATSALEMNCLYELSLRSPY